MMIRKALVTMASAGLLLGSTAAVAQSAEIRNAAPIEEYEAEGLNGFGWVIALLVAAGVTIAVVSSGDDTEDEPDSV